MMIAFAVSVLAAAVAWITWTSTKARLSYDLHKIPGPSAWPFLGNLGGIIGSSYMHKTLAKWTELYGPIYQWRLGPRRILVISEPSEIVKLCSKEAQSPKWMPAYAALNTRSPHYNFLATPMYEEWRYIRKMLNPAFSPDNIRKMFPKIYQTAVQAADVLQQLCRQGPIEMNDFSKRITADVIAGFAFEEEMGNLQLGQTQSGRKALVPRPELDASRTLSDSLSMLFTNPLYALLLAVCPWHPRARAFKQAKSLIDAIEDVKVANIRKQGVQPESNTHVWACLSRLVNYKDGSQLCNDAIAAQVSILFAAGFETTAHTITWALFELAANQELQDQVHEELRKAGLAVTNDQAQPRPLDYSDLSKLPWVDAIARETLRLHATAPLGSIREAKEDMVVLGYRIPKGTPLMLGPYAMHTSPQNFLQPYKFLPARWVGSSEAITPVTSKSFPDATMKGKRHALAASWNPFSNGPRNCIGQSLAIAELRTVLAVLLSRFRFELPDGMDRDKYLDTEQVAWVTLQPRQGLPLRVTPLAPSETSFAAPQTPDPLTNLTGPTHQSPQQAF